MTLSLSLSLFPPPCSNSKHRKILYCGVTRENRVYFYTRGKYVSANEPRPRYYTGNTPVTIPRCVSLFRGEPSAQTGRKEFRVLSLEMVSRMIHTHTHTHNVQWFTMRSKKNILSHTTELGKIRGKLILEKLLHDGNEDTGLDDNSFI